MNVVIILLVIILVIVIVLLVTRKVRGGGQPLPFSGDKLKPGMDSKDLKYILYKLGDEFDVDDMDDTNINYVLSKITFEANLNNIDECNEIINSNSELTDIQRTYAHSLVDAWNCISEYDSAISIFRIQTCYPDESIFCNFTPHDIKTVNKQDLIDYCNSQNFDQEDTNILIEAVDKIIEHSDFYYCAQNLVSKRNMVMKELEDSGVLESM